MKTIGQNNWYALDVRASIWQRVFLVSPLVVIGTKEGNHYDLAPKHMAMPLGFENYFGFVCTPKHATYQNIKINKTFTVSYLLPDSVVTAALSASPRCHEKANEKPIVKVLPTIKASRIDALGIESSYLFLECESYKIIDGFGDNSIITGKVIAAHIDKNYLKTFEIDEQQQLKEHPLLAYITPGRFAKISKTYNFPFPKGFKF